MSSPYIIDASVIIKWFSLPNEEGVKDARKIYELGKNGALMLHAPSFLIIETLNILARKKRVSVAMQRKTISLLLNSGIIYAPLTQDAPLSLVSLMKRHDITAYDALYVALAVENKCLLITVDEKLLGLDSLSITPTRVLQTLSE